MTCGRGGTGRRAALRSLWPKGRGSSSLLDRTTSCHLEIARGTISARCRRRSFRAELARLGAEAFPKRTAEIDPAELRRGPHQHPRLRIAIMARRRALGESDERPQILDAERRRIFGAESLYQPAAQSRRDFTAGGPQRLPLRLAQ